MNLMFFFVRCTVAADGQMHKFNYFSAIIAEKIAFSKQQNKNYERIINLHLSERFVVKYI